MESSATQQPRLALGLAAGVVGLAVCLWSVATLGAVRLSVWLTPRPEPALHARLAARQAGPVIPVVVATHGRDIFERTCAQCHSSSGLGVAGLGKDLVRSDFVADTADAELAAFVERGRPVDDPANSTKILMPPKGGNAALTADDLSAVVAYMRGLQDPRRMPQLTAWVPTPIKVEVTAQDKSAALAAAGGDEELAGYIASGNKMFHSMCVVCHGAGGVGIKGNGKALASNEFVRSLDDDALLAFIKQGRAPTDPKNTTGIQMPPKGGNPAMSDDDILDVIAYLRTLQGNSPRTAAGK